MLWTIIVILLVLWLLGWRGNFGGGPFLGDNNSLVHVILVIVVILIILAIL